MELIHNVRKISGPCHAVGLIIILFRVTKPVFYSLPLTEAFLPYVMPIGATRNHLPKIHRLTLHSYPQIFLIWASNLVDVMELQQCQS